MSSQATGRKNPLLSYFAAVLLVWAMVASVEARYENGMINLGILAFDPFNWPGGLAGGGILGLDSVEATSGYQYWAQLVNNSGGIMVGSTQMYVNLTVVQIGNTSATQHAAAQAAALTGDYDFLFGPFSSSWSINVALALHGVNSSILLGHAAASSVFQCQSAWQTRPPCQHANDRRFPLAWSTCPVGEQFLDAPLNLVALQGARTIAGWYQNEDFCHGIVTGAYSSAQGFGLITASAPFVMALNATQSDYDAMAQQIADIDPDIIVAGSRVGSCTMFLASLKKINYLPKALFTTLCATDPTLEAHLNATGLTMDDARYIVDTALWDHRLKGPEFTDQPPFFFTNTTSTVSSAQLFYDDYLASEFGQYWDPTNVPLSFAMGYALQTAISKTASIDSTVVLASFPTILVSSFFGEIGFDGFGQDSAKSVGNVQIGHNGTVELISPLSSSTYSLVFPMPTWDERVFIATPFSTGAEKAIAVIAAAGIVFSLVMAVLTFIFRKTKAIQASSPLFLYIMLTGSILLYVGIFTWTLTNSDALCMAHWWVLGVGFILMFGGLLIKSWRISRIFNTRDLSIIRISNQELSTVVGLLVAVEVILLIVWTAVDRSKSITLTTDPLRPSLDYLACSSNTTGTVILAIMGAYKFLMIVGGVFLSVQTWKIKYSIYNESRAVAFSMYNLFFFLVLAIIVELVINQPDQRTAQFVVRSVVILLGTFLPIAVLFIPKFAKSVYLNSENMASRSQSLSNSRGASSKKGKSPKSTGIATENHSRGSDEETGTQKKVDRLKTHNSRLKKEVRDLRLEVQRLKDELEAANAKPPQKEEASSS